MSLLKDALADFKNLSNTPKTSQAQVSNTQVVLSSSAPPKSMVWSREQQAVLESTNPHLAVIALAGSGKTQTAMEYMKRRSLQKWLYFVFNRSMKDEVAQQNLPYIKATTLHGYVFPKYGAPLQHKLKNQYHYAEVLAASKAKPSPLLEKLHAELLWETVQAFAQSADTLVSLKHIPAQLWWNVLKHPLNMYTAQDIVQQAYALWEACIDPTHPMSASHDHYLKIAQLSGMTWNHPVLLDEAQDASACMLALITHQSHPWVMLGDPYQTLYTFRGAVGNFAENTPILPLTGSFRFGENLAHLANHALEHLHAQWFLQGRSAHSGAIIENETPERGDVILTHTNEKAMWWGMQLLEKGHSVQWLGPMQSTFDTLQKLEAWRQGGKPARPEWSSFSFAEYETWIEQNPEHPDAIALKWLGKVNQKSPVWQHLQSRPENTSVLPDFTIGTTHQSKGLTFKKVFVDTELSESCHQAQSQSDKIEAWKRMYVALTRAQHQVRLSPLTQNHLQSARNTPPQALNCFDDE